MLDQTSDFHHRRLRPGALGMLAATVAGLALSAPAPAESTGTSVAAAALVGVDDPYDCGYDHAWPAAKARVLLVRPGDHGDDADHYDCGYDDARLDDPYDCGYDDAWSEDGEEQDQVFLTGVDDQQDHFDCGYDLRWDDVHAGAAPPRSGDHEDHYDCGYDDDGQARADGHLTVSVSLAPYGDHEDHYDCGYDDRDDWADDQLPGALERPRPIDHEDHYDCGYEDDVAWRGAQGRAAAAPSHDQRDHLVSADDREARDASSPSAR